MIQIESEVVERRLWVTGKQNEFSDLANWLREALERKANVDASDDVEMAMILNEFKDSSSVIYRTENTVVRLIDMLRGHMG